jgi:hypothetical protein
VGFYSEQAAESIAAELTGVHVQTFVSAHTHVQVDRHVSLLAQDGGDLPANTRTNHDSHSYGNNYGKRQWHVINPGSVGLPLNGDPSAQFAILTSVPEEQVAGGWQATHYRVPYDRRPTLEAYETTGMAAAGGVITRLFYWELVTADAEIVLFYRWARTHGYNPDQDMVGTFRIYCRETGRDAYVRSRDPLYQKVVKW